MWLGIRHGGEYTFREGKGKTRINKNPKRKREEGISKGGQQQMKYTITHNYIIIPPIIYKLTN